MVASSRPYGDSYCRRWNQFMRTAVHRRPGGRDSSRSLSVECRPWHSAASPQPWRTLSACRVETRAPEVVESTVSLSWGRSPTCLVATQNFPPHISGTCSGKDQPRFPLPAHSLTRLQEFGDSSRCFWRRARQEPARVPGTSACASEDNIFAPCRETKI